MARIQSVYLKGFLCSILGVLLVASTVFAQGQHVARRITNAVDDGKRVTLHGNTPVQIQPQYGQASDLGVVDDSTPTKGMLLVLKRSPEQEIALKQLMTDLHNPKSTQYHKWLKPTDFSKQFGIGDEDMQTVTTWLQSKGFVVNKVSQGKTAIDFSGSAGQVKNAFHTELHTYSKNGVTFHANSSDPQVPAALSSVVAGLASLNDIKPKSYAHVLGKATFSPKTHQSVPQWSYPAGTDGVYLVFAPGDVAVQYDLNPVYKAGYTGTGETIGIISASGVDNTVVANYRKLFGLSDNVPSEIVVGNDPGSNGDGAGDEAALDVEVSGSVAPDAKVYLYVGEDTDLVQLSGLYGAALRAVDDDVADVLSLSYGICEQELGLSTNLYMNNLWAQAAAQGQSVFVSSGDSGSGGCDNGQPQVVHGLAVNGFSSTPYNVSVGGTDFYYSDYNNSSDLGAQIASYWNTKGTIAPGTSLLKPVPEQPWNNAFGLNVASQGDGTTASGSGGASGCVQGTEDPTTGYYTSCTTGYAKPSWQTGVGVPQDGVRDIPDVSLFAANGDNYSFWPICYAVTDCVASNIDPSTDPVTITGIGGTSASAPAMAGIMALVDQSQKGRQGNANFVLYPLATQVPSVFHDVTVGNNNVPCVDGTPNCDLDTNGDGFYTLQKYETGVGYDLASGLGSLDVNNLITNWNKITFAPTTTSLTLSSTTFAHGTPIIATSSVTAGGGASSVPAGTVALISSASGNTGVGTLSLVNGTGQASLNSLPGGTYSLTAQYGGDGTYAGSTSTPVNVTVTPESSTVSLGGYYFGVDANGNTLNRAPLVSGLSTQYGTFFWFDVQVFGTSSTAISPDGVPTGQITLTDNGTAWTTLNLNAKGVAEIQTSALSSGTHVIVASYSGDGSFNAASSSSFTVTITKGVPQILISYSVGDPTGTPPTIFMPTSPRLEVPVEVSSAAGQLPVTGTITVTYGKQTQVVQLEPVSFAAITSMGTGIATFDNNTPGTYALNATYSGDANLQPIAGAYNPSNVTVYTNSLATSTTTLSVNETNVSPEGQPLNVTVKVTGGTTTPTGWISLYQGGIYQLPGLLVALDDTGTANVPIPQNQLLSSGSLPFIATYTGDHIYNPSTSLPLTVTANAGDFSFTATNAALSVASGSSGTTMISVGSSLSTFPQQLGGTIALSCATSSPDLTCSLSPATLTLPIDSSQYASSTVTINTSIPAAAASSVARSSKNWITRGGFALAALLLFGIPARRLRRWGITLCFLLVIGLSAIGCGSSGKTAPTQPVTPVNTNAPAGNYTATITAVGSGITHTLVVRVNVH